MGEEKHGYVRCLGRKNKRAAFFRPTPTNLQLEEHKEELQKLKDGLMEEKEQMMQMKEDFIYEKEQLLLEKEKINNLSKKLELLISQFPAIPSGKSHCAQVEDASASTSASTLRGTTFREIGNIPSRDEQQVENISRRSMSQKSVLEFLQPITIGSRVQIYCRGIQIKVVAEGVCISIIDDEKGVEDSLVKVYIAKILIPSEKLLKSCVGAKTIGEVLHKCIEWEYMNVMEI